MRNPTLILIPAACALAAGDTASARAHYDRVLARRTVPLLQEVLRFPTVAGNAAAQAAQKAWLLELGTELGFVVRDAGKVTEIELPASTPGPAPVLGLVVHGDVQPVDDHWTLPPFSGTVKKGRMLGRGAADDKGPLVQALMTMKALKEAGAPRTHVVRLLVGSDEESTNEDIATYLKEHRAPDLSLVLDANFTVTVGEKAWTAFWVDTPLGNRGEGPLQVLSLEAGLAPSIVPDRAEIRIGLGPGGRPEQLDLLQARLARKSPGKDLRTELRREAELFVTRQDGTCVSRPEALVLVVHGRAAHGGVNLEGGRNALVGLARLLDGELPAGGADDLLSIVRLAGQDIYGSSLGLPRHPVFGPTTVNPATLKAQADGAHRLFINLRRTPALSAEALRKQLESLVEGANARTGAHMKPGGWWEDEPLAFDPEAKLVKRLLRAYERGTGRAEGPNISGGGTYAKRLPNAIAFGMWFPESGPYPGHDVDERVPVRDLHRGVHVLLEALGDLGDLACSEPLKEPFKP